jgi:hypothetical protein
MSVITILRRLRQEDHEFMASLDYIARSRLRKIRDYMLRFLLTLYEDTCSANLLSLPDNIYSSSFLVNDFLASCVS